jgi:hypothetical protein
VQARKAEVPLVAPSQACELETALRAERQGFNAPLGVIPASVGRMARRREIARAFTAPDRAVMAETRLARQPGWDTGKHG